MDTLNLQLTLSGRVQGVRFRYLAQQEAIRLGLFGYARNLPEGLLQIEVEGEKNQVDTFIAWCKSSPGISNVKELHTQSGTLKNYGEFRIY